MTQVVISCSELVPKYRTETTRRVCRARLSCVSVFPRIWSGSLSLQVGSAKWTTERLLIWFQQRWVHSKNHKDVHALWAGIPVPRIDLSELGFPRSRPKDKHSSANGLFGWWTQEWSGETGRVDINSTLSRSLPSQETEAQSGGRLCRWCEHALD